MKTLVILGYYFNLKYLAFMLQYRIITRGVCAKEINLIIIVLEGSGSIIRKVSSASAPRRPGLASCNGSVEHTDFPLESQAL